MANCSAKEARSISSSSTRRTRFVLGIFYLLIVVMRQTLSRFQGPVYVVSMTIKGPEAANPETPAKTLIPFEHRVERAAGDFRRGAPVLIADMEGESGLIVAAETVNDSTLMDLVRRYGAP